MKSIENITMTEAAYNFILEKLDNEENIINAIKTGQLSEDELDVGDKVIWYKDKEMKQKDWAVYSDDELFADGEKVDAWLIRNDLHYDDRDSLIIDEAAIPYSYTAYWKPAIDYKYDDYEFYKDNNREPEVYVHIHIVTAEYIKQAGKNSNLYEDEIIIEIENLKTGKSEYIPSHYECEFMLDTSHIGNNFDNKTALAWLLKEYDLQIYDAELLQYQLEREIEYLKLETKYKAEYDLLED